MSADVTAMPSHHEPESGVHEQRALGFWLYLMGDAVIFGLLFMTYGIMVGNTAGGPAGKMLFSLNNAALETALLLVSSTTFGFASLSSKAGNRSAVLAWLLYGGMDFAQSRNVILFASLCLAVVGSFCTVGAVLERHVPLLAWLAVACVLAYWLMVASAAVMSVVRICTTIPQFGYPIP